MTDWSDKTIKDIQYQEGCQFNAKRILNLFEGWTDEKNLYRKTACPDMSHKKGDCRLLCWEEFGDSAHDAEKTK